MSEDKPSGTLMISTVAMPAHTNANGDIFGGWLLSQMDVGGAAFAVQEAGNRVATVAIEKMTFHVPVSVGDLVRCYAHTIKTGRTSITVQVDAWATSILGGNTRKVTEGVFTFVAIDAKGRPKAINWQRPVSP